MLKGIDNLLGLQLYDEPDITPEQKQLIVQREEARNAKDWSKSDEFRASLLEQGIALRDTQYGPIWSRV
jgi:cysteinyl-tRNA synthetase